MSQCVRCPIYNKNNKTCMMCRCYMPVKAMFEDQECAGIADGIPVARGWQSEGERKMNERRPLMKVAQVLNDEEEN